jgi:hypothetical protein
MDAKEAVARFPEHAEEIKRQVNQGPSATGGTTGSYIERLGFERDMVLIRTVWLRHEQPQQVQPEGEEYVPVRPVVRQVTIIGEAVVLDHPSPWMLEDDAEMPVGWVRNIEIPGSPYGMGEPERIESAQRAINQLMHDLTLSIRFNSQPERVLPESMRDTSPNAKADLGSRPDRVHYIADGLFSAVGGRINLFLERAPPPVAAVEMLRFLVDQIDDLGGSPDVLQGRPTYAGQSGRAVTSLQEAAMSPMSLRASNLEQAVCRVWRLAAHAAITFMREEEQARLWSMHGPETVKLFMARAKSMHYDANCEINLGGDTNRASKRVEAMENRQIGAISLDTLQRELEIEDPMGEQMKLMREAIPQATEPGQSQPQARSST